MVFLTSTGFTNPMVYQTLVENTSYDMKSACIIATATLPQKDKHPIAIKSYEFLREKGLKVVDFLDVEFDNPIKLRNYDLIFILGGNSSHLLKHMYSSGAVDILRDMIADHKNVIGASAGSWLLTTGNIYSKYFKLDFEEEGDFFSDGLRITDDILFPHYDMFCQRVPGLEEQLSRAETMYGFKYTRLKNMDYIYVDNDGLVTKVIN